MKHSEKGFTLVELVVTIAVASIVTAAALSVLLLGMRINRQANDTADRQNTTRVLLSALESMATEGQLSEVVLQGNDWAVQDADGRVLFSYKYNYETGYGTVYTGGSVDEDDNITFDSSVELMPDLLASAVELKDNLVTFSVTTESGTYTSSAYCRQAVGGKTDADDGTAGGVVGDLAGKDEPESGDSQYEPRNHFLWVLASQYQLLDGSANMGLILKDGRSTGEYYSQWYVGGKYGNGWSKATPWCACYVSWCVAQVNSELKPFANVVYFVDYFKGQNAFEKDNQGASWLKPDDSASVVPGDLVFFDWNGNGDPQHVGVVLFKGNDFIHTIEGNSSGKVSLRMYKLSDPRILGYGVLNWDYSNSASTT